MTDIQTPPTFIELAGDQLTDRDTLMYAMGVIDGSMTIAYDLVGGDHDEVARAIMERTSPLVRDVHAKLETLNDTR